MDTIRIATLAGAPALPRVLLVAHPLRLAAALASGLKAAGLDVEIAASMAEVPHVLARFQPGVALLYLAAADPLGLEGVALLVRTGDGGIIAVLGEDSEAARIASLDGGADDVVGAGTPPGELAARVRAVHRRLLRSSAILAQEPAGPILLEPAHRYVVGAQGERVALSEAEFITLETLLDADGAPVTREWLGRVALHRPLHSDDRSVDQLVLKLRRKLAAVGAADRTILSARRQGYVIADPSRFRSVGPTGQSQPDDSNRPLAAVGG